MRGGVKTAFFEMQYYSRLTVGKEYALRIERFLKAYGLNENRTGDMSIFTNHGTLEGIVCKNAPRMGNFATVTITSNNIGSIYIVMEKLIGRIPAISQHYRILKQESGRHLKKGERKTPSVSPADTSPMPSVCPTILLRAEYADLDDFRRVHGLKKDI